MKDFLANAMSKIPETPDSYESVELAVKIAIQQAVRRDRRKIKTLICNADYNHGDIATHEIIRSGCRCVDYHPLPFEETDQ